MSEDQPMTISQSDDDLADNSASETKDVLDSDQPTTSSFGGWISNFVQSAKEKVNKTTMDSIRRDLNELKDAVQQDTTSMVYSTASLVKNTFNEIGNSVTEIGSLGTGNQTDDLEDLVKTSTTTKSDAEPTSNVTLPFDLKTINSWTNKFTDTAKTTITMVKDTLVESIFANYSIDELYDEPFVVKDGQMIQIENWNELLHKLQVDPDTYCREPNGLDDFDTWLVKFNLINYQKQTEYLIENVPEIKQYHDELVPRTLSESDFWHRYFYKVHQLKEKQANLLLKNQNCSKAGDKAESKITEEKKQSNQKQESANAAPTSISRSSTSTEDWEKMSESNNSLSADKNHQKTELDSKCSSDDDREWVKCE